MDNFVLSMSATDSSQSTGYFFCGSKQHFTTTLMLGVAGVTLRHSPLLQAPTSALTRTQPILYWRFSMMDLQSHAMNWRTRSVICLSMITALQGKQKNFSCNWCMWFVAASPTTHPYLEFKSTKKVYWYWSSPHFQARHQPSTTSRLCVYNI